MHYCLRVVAVFVGILLSTNGETWKPVLPAGTLMKAQMEAYKNAKLPFAGSENYQQVHGSDITKQQQVFSPQFLIAQQQPSFVAVAQGVKQMQDQQKLFIVQMLRNLRLNVLAQLVESVELPELFEQPASPKTILAPSDEAFSLLPNVLMSRISRDSLQSSRLLRYHVVPASLPVNSISNDLILDTFQPGVRIRFNVYGIGDNTRITANGVLISHFNIISVPNLIIHVLDRVLYPFPRGDMTATLFTQNCTLYDGMTTALAASGLEEFFRTSGPGESFTLFVPTTQAFQFVPKKNFNKILADPDKVSAFVLSHTVNGTFYSHGLRDGQWLTTISRFLVPIWVGVVSEGNSRRLDSVNGQVRVLQADIPVDNGVMHIIDRPINPVELVDLFRCESDFV